MPFRMQAFVHELPQLPARRPMAERKARFDEIYRGYAPELAQQQAARCAQCGIPFCQAGCPLHNDIPDWLALVAEGRLQEAYVRSASTNPMPEICGRICPQDRLCEGVCVLEQSGHGRVTIGAIEQWITDTAWERGWVPQLEAQCERPERVSIVGAGPAGLAAAEILRIRGVQVTVYDRQDRAGGLLMYGIPNFKLDKSIVSRRIERLQAGGVKFVLGWELGRDEDLLALRQRSDAVLLAMGAQSPRALGLPVEASARRLPAMRYLTEATRRQLGEALSLDSWAGGLRVIVLGGGDTAMDCARTAIRQGARSVHCVYRRDRASMPGSAREVRHAEEEGVLFQWLSSPRSLRVGPDGAIELTVGSTQLGSLGPDRRRVLIEGTGPERVLQADLLLEALGYEAEDLDSMCGQELRLAADGLVAVDRTYATSVPGVFAAGDVVRGPSLVVWALRDGMRAASAILRSLGRGAS
jgi:glutamate synthase (NADPH/NADH) small chain